MISIIVPVYNAEKYIETTIAMVRRQTWQDWELILVDDCSTDGSAEVIRRCIGNDTEKIRFIQKKVNEGAAKARNTGVDAAGGRYIAFLDADDIWYREKLAREMAYMEKHDAAFVFSGYEFGDEEGIPTGKAVHVPKTLRYREALSRTVIFTSTVLLDTEKIEKSLLYMPSVGSEDTATWWQILKSGVTAYGLDEPLAVYRRPAQSLSSNKKTAVKRIWNLYRTVAGMNAAAACFYMFRWAWRATVRRGVADTIRNHVESIKRFSVLELALLGLLVQTAFFAYVWFEHYYPIISSFRFSQEGFEFGTGLKLYFKGHLLVLAIYLVTLLFLTKVSGGMKTGYLKPGSIFASQATALVITNVIIYFQLSLMRNWLVPGQYMAALTLIQIVFAGIWALTGDWIYRSVFPPVETLVIRGEESLDPVVRAFNTRQDRFQIMRTLKVKAGKETETDAGSNAEGAPESGSNLEEIREECLRWYGAVILGNMEEQVRRELLEFCYSHFIRVYILPDIGDILMQGTEAMDLFDVPILELKEYSISWEKRVIKRAADIGLSAVLLLLLSPLFLIRAVYGKVKYKRVFTGQPCAAKGKKQFSLHRFAGKTCAADAAAAEMAAMEQAIADQVTAEQAAADPAWIGGLPMLWDVFCGKMSMVGPAPLPMGETDRLIDADPRYFYRLRVKPGLTGYAQVHGKKTTVQQDLLKLDLIYIQHFSLLMDVKLLLLSLRRSR